MRFQSISRLVLLGVLLAAPAALASRVKVSPEAGRRFVAVAGHFAGEDVNLKAEGGGTVAVNRANLARIALTMNVTLGELGEPYRADPRKVVPDEGHALSKDQRMLRVQLKLTGGAHPAIYSPTMVAVAHGDIREGHVEEIEPEEN